MALAVKSTLPPLLSDVLRGRQVPPFSMVVHSARSFQNVTSLGWSRKAPGVVSSLGPGGEERPPSSYSIGFWVEQRSFSLVQANEKLSAGFQREGTHM